MAARFDDKKRHVKTKKYGNEALLDTEASSKIIKLQSFINFPALLCFEILQMLETSSVYIFSGSLNVEWAVNSSNS